MKAAGGDQLPGLWYVDEESQGEHPDAFCAFCFPSRKHSLEY